MKEKYEITIDRHPFVSVKEMKAYIAEAIHMYRAEFPQSYIHKELNIKVKRIKNEKLQ